MEGQEQFLVVRYASTDVWNRTYHLECFMLWQKRTIYYRSAKKRITTAYINMRVILNTFTVLFHVGSAREKHDD